jgi:cation diffusion facilitator family transporter
LQTANQSSTENAEKEKKSAASSSIYAAVALTGFKIVVGLMTNSLGILAEAAHSGLDLVAALVTFVAVSFSGKPADVGHHYGHGKIENLSALFETLLLLVTCVWIIYESVQRLLVKSVEIDASYLAFLVMAVSIIIDFSRSRMLYKAARKYNSQALEADALHFSTDIWSSSVVIVGLVAVRLAQFLPGFEFLGNADSFAAFVVALIVIYVSLQLGRRTVQGLLDHAPKGLREEIARTVGTIPGVCECHKFRARTSGAETFVDLHIIVEASQSLEAAHELTKKVEESVKRLARDADVTVHVDPKKPKPVVPSGSSEA